MSFPDAHRHTLCRCVATVLFCAGFAAPQSDMPFIGRDSQGNVIVSPLAGQTAFVAGVDVQAQQQLVVSSLTGGVTSSYDALEKTMTREELAERLQQVQAVSRRQKVLVTVGGLTADGIRTAAAELLVPGGLPWRPLPALGTARRGPAMVAFQDRLFVMGGTLDVKGPLRVNSTEMFNGLSWQPSAPMTLPRSYHAAVEYHGEVFVAGGTADTDPNVVDSTTEVFDGVSWRNGPQMLQGRIGHGMAVYEDAIIVVGGQNGTDPLAECEMLKWTLDAGWGGWQPWPALNIPRSGPGVAVTGGLLVVAGGVSALSTVSIADGDILDSVEVYTEAGWSLITSMKMPAPRCCFSLVAHYGGLVAAGGQIVGGLTDEVREAAPPSVPLLNCPGRPGVCASRLIGWSAMTP